MLKKFRSSVLLATLEKILNYKSLQGKRRFILKYHSGEIAIIFSLLEKGNREKLFEFNYP